MAKTNRCPSYKTNRLRLRPLQAGDEEFLAALDSDPAVMQYIHSGPLTPEQAQRWAVSQIEMAPHRWHLHKWMVELIDQQERIGWVELSKFRGQFDPGDEYLGDDINIGYEFAPAYWNQGFAAEAIGPVLAYAFEVLEAPRVVAYARPANQRSTRLLEKLGFQPGARQGYRDEGRHPCRLYSLTKP
jgi:RimJ/RimL family protein N-acetyltransferase